MRFKIFSDYFLVIDELTHSISVVSVKRKIEKIMKPIIKSQCTYYAFYINGVRNEYSLRKIVELVVVK